MRTFFASLAGITLLSLSIATAAQENVLSLTEKSEGWKLLFNGKDLKGWSNFKSKDVKPGWKVADGTLVCVDPSNAGDLVTKDEYEWFELEFDYKMGFAANSGVMYHVSDKGGMVWETGPEIQLQDNPNARDAQLCGWLYQLYKPEIDPKTQKPFDATKPNTEWGHIRVVISPEKCEHYVNGVKYFEYVLGSEDFNKRVAASKFGSMPNFAKAEKGFIALQGDHGTVSFKNIKIKPLKAKK